MKKLKLAIDIMEGTRENVLELKPGKRKKVRKQQRMT
jgi:hypothetical protein